MSLWVIYAWPRGRLYPVLIWKGRDPLRAVDEITHLMGSPVWAYELA